METSAVLLIVVVTVLVGISIGFPSDSDDSKANNQVGRWRPPSKLQWNFSVQVDYHLKPNEKIGITGDTDFLGAWSPNKALILNRTDTTKWSGSVWFSPNLIVNYRFFVGIFDSIGDCVQILKWETHLDGRTVKLGTKNIKTTDRFGIVKDRREVNRGWLNSGHILQFKLFRNPIELDNVNVIDQTIFIKVTPVDYNWSAKKKLLAPIPPSCRVNVECIRMEYGKSEIRDQPKYGVPYERDDIVLFHITTNDLKNVAYKFTLHIQDDRESERIQTLGYQYLYPETIHGTEGSIELVVMSSDGLSSIGTIKVGYLLIKPLSTNEVNFRTSFSHYWRKNWIALDAGHRGLGESLELAKGAAPIIENTIASMKASGDIGADIVEFDVQLTRDLIPIIYHDYVVYGCMRGKKPKSKDDLTELLIKNLTYNEIKDLTTFQIVNSKVIEYPSHNMEPQEDRRLFPLFADFLTKIDSRLGFNIEIKWPQLQKNGQLESYQTIDKNLYVDRILDVILQKGCGRFIFFSSLDADVCTMLNFKQNMYPVMFLGPMEDNFYADPRSDSYLNTINNAHAMELTGIVPHTRNFIKNGISQVYLGKDLYLQVVIWGNDSNSKESVKYFKSLGTAVLIYDRIDLYMPKKETSVFGREGDWPELFEKQCSN